jgi:hypothetical protein
MPALCTDADGVDREDIHRNLISEAGRFSRARWASRAGRMQTRIKIGLCRLSGVSQAIARRLSSKVNPSPAPTTAPH